MDIVMRTLIDLPEDQLRALTEIGRRTGQSRAAVIRDAVAGYLATRRGDGEAAAFGLWGPKAPDGLAYQRKARAEW
jgi:metal-responsive CopG/Arc/MetJ family transcriptional regulator